MVQFRLSHFFPLKPFKFTQVNNVNTRQDLKLKEWHTDWAVTDRLEFGVQMTHGPFDTGLVVETGVNGVTVFANVALLACAVKERLIVLEIFADALLTFITRRFN